MASGIMYSFGPFRLDPDSRLLTRDGSAVPLAPRTFDLLHVFVLSEGRLLSKNHLLSEVWGEVNVEEASLSFQISTLRKALGEFGNNWIETVPKHGYRFVASVTTDAAPKRTLEIPAQGEKRAREFESARAAAQGMAVLRARGRWLVFTAVVAGVVAIGGWLLHQPATEQRSEVPLKIVPLTTNPGVETDPSLSPDGTKVAYSGKDESKKDLDIFVKRLGEGTAVPLTMSPDDECCPAWSPDGRLIAFLRGTEGEVEGEIVLVPADGGPERVIARPSPSWYPEGRFIVQGLSWFPDSDALAIVGRAVGSTPVSSEENLGVASSQRYRGSAIYAVSVSGVEAHPITTPPEGAYGDFKPSVSPDGRRLVFSRSGGYWTSGVLNLVALDGQKRAVGEPEQLIPSSDSRFSGAEGRHQTDGAAWGPGGDEVFFTQDGIWAITLAGDRIPRLVPTPGYIPGRFTLARDGKRLVFANGSFDLDIWRIAGPANSGAAIVGEGAPMIATTKVDTNPQYSPDGKRIAFTSTRSGRPQIWVAGADGSNPFQITGTAAGNGTPRWSPDGRYVAYDAVAKGEPPDVYVVPAEGGPSLRVTTDDSYDAVPSWSRDGKWIYFESKRSGQSQLWKTQFPSGSTVQVTTKGGVAAFESPDSRWLYYSKRDILGLWRIPLAGGNEELVKAGVQPVFWGMYDKGVCVLSFFDDPVTIECANFDSTQFKTIASFPNQGQVRPTGPSFAISPDGQWILYSRWARWEADLMLIENFGEFQR